MKKYTEEQVRKKVAGFVKTHPTIVSACRAAGITKAEMSVARNGGRIPAKLLRAAGLQKIEVYTDV